MSQFAPVVPIPLAKHLAEQEELGDYHLLLAHDVLARPDEYKLVYGGIREGGGTIIMDNSLIELGRPMDIAEMLAVFKTLRPDWIVLPDHLGDYKKTLGATCKALFDWRQLTPIQRLDTELMGVVQGSTFEECVSCAQWMLTQPEITAICVPRVLVELLGSRMPVLTWLLQQRPEMPIHLLGFSDNILDDIVSASMYNVMGIDSAVPIRLGLQNKPLLLDKFVDAGKRGDFWDRSYSRFEPLSNTTILSNIRNVRSWIDVRYFGK